ncbi:MAG: hypothetical protein ACLUI3_02465 [Christensenellales bacterium]
MAADARAHRRGGDAQARSEARASSAHFPAQGDGAAVVGAAGAGVGGVAYTVRRGVLNLRRISALRRWSVRMARAATSGKSCAHRA